MNSTQLIFFALFHGAIISCSAPQPTTIVKPLALDISAIESDASQKHTMQYSLFDIMLYKKRNKILPLKTYQSCKPPARERPTMETINEECENDSDN